MLLSYFIPVVSSCCTPYVCLVVLLWTCIYSVDTLLYPYTLPLIHLPYSFSSLCLSCNLSSSLRLLQHPSIDLYPCPTDVIAIFHSLRVSGIAISEYPSIVLIIFCHAFFFNKKMACSSSVLAFMASTSNSMIKSAVFYFPCLNVSIFHLASAALDLSLNVVLISFMKSS